MSAQKKKSEAKPHAETAAADGPADTSTVPKPVQGKADAKAKKDDKPAKATEAGKPSFMTRLQAWWHGHELQAPAAMPGKPPHVVAAVDGPEADPGLPDGSSTAATARIRIAQKIWSKGFVWPGGEEFALDLTKPLGLDSASTLLEIGSGLGGGARAVAQGLGAYVTGFDFDPHMAAEAMIQSTEHSLEDKAKVSPIDPASPSLRKDFFRAALVREALYQVEDKKLLIGEVLEAVKKDQPIVIFDFFAGKAQPTQALADWIALEPHPIHLTPMDEVVALLKERHVEMRVTQDDTELYCAMALRAWSSFVERLEGTKVTKDLLIPLVCEVELWTRRIAALQAGDLQVWRLVGYKRVPVA